MTKPPAADRPGSGQPIFILAPPRSFTSLVCAALGQHPELYGVPELNLFQCENMNEFLTGKDVDGSIKSPFWKAMRHGLLRTVSQLYAGEQTIHGIAMAERWIRHRRTLAAGEVYKELCAKVSPLRIVEKSPAYLRKDEYLERLLETFPEARFIHLIRHPRSQCQSVLDAKGGMLALFFLRAIDESGDEPVLDPQIVWHDGHLRIMRFLEQLPAEQSFRLRGEDFFADTDSQLAAIFGWLGVSTSRRALSAAKHPERSPFSNVGPVNARLGNDVGFLTSPKLRRHAARRMPDLDGPLAWRPDDAAFHPQVRSLAEELGYR